MRFKKTSPRSSGFLDKTILATVSFLKETVVNERVAARCGLLQQFDPRFKCLSTGLLLVAVLLSRNISGLVAFYFAILVLVSVSSIHLVFFLKRTWFFIPLFSLCIAVPALFHWITPGETLWFFRVFKQDVIITRQGVASAMVFFLRVLVSVSLVVLLVLTTRHHAILKALRMFRVPLLFVMTLGMTYRYIFLLLEVIGNAFTAVKSRVGYVSSPKTGRRVVAANMAGLWLSSYRLQTQVYDAMISRGYTGESQILEDFHAQAIDWVMLAASLFTLTGTLCLNHFIH